MPLAKGRIGSTVPRTRVTGRAVSEPGYCFISRGAGCYWIVSQRLRVFDSRGARRGAGFNESERGGEGSGGGIAARCVALQRLCISVWSVHGGRQASADACSLNPADISPDEGQHWSAGTQGGSASQPNT